LIGTPVLSISAFLPTEVVGTATLRMADVSEVVRLLSERLRFEDLLLAGESAARKSKRLKARKPWVHCL
jgi:hypothetical protein